MAQICRLNLLKDLDVYGIYRNSSSSWTDSTVMPLPRLVQSSLWQPPQHLFFLSQEWVSTADTDAWPVCCWIATDGDPSLLPLDALVTASKAQAAQCPCKNNLCTSFVIIHCTRLAQKYSLKTISNLFSCSLGHSHLLLWEKTDSEISNCFSLKAWQRCQYKHQRWYHYSPDLGYTAQDFLLHVIYTLLIHCWRWWGYESRYCSW